MKLFRLYGYLSSYMAETKIDRELECLRFRGSGMMAYHSLIIREPRNNDFKHKEKNFSSKLNFDLIFWQKVAAAKNNFFLIKFHSDESNRIIAKKNLKTELKFVHRWNSFKPTALETITVISCSARIPGPSDNLTMGYHVYIILEFGGLPQLLAHWSN